MLDSLGEGHAPNDLVVAQLGRQGVDRVVDAARPRHDGEADQVAHQGRHESAQRLGPLVPSDEPQLGRPMDEGGRLHGPPALVEGPPRAVRVRRRVAQGQPFAGAVAPERGHGGQHVVGAGELEVAERGPADLELDAPDPFADEVALGPDRPPPVGALGLHLGGLVVEAGADVLGTSRAEGEAGADPVCLVRRAGVGPAHEARPVLGAQLQVLEVAEQVDPGHGEGEVLDEGTEQFLEVRDRATGPARPEELGPWLDAQGGQPAARGEADPPRLVVEAVAVLAPAVRRQAEGEEVELEGHRHRHPFGPEPVFFETRQEPLGQVAVPGEVEGVDARGQLHRTGPGRRVLGHTQICD